MTFRRVTVIWILLFAFCATFAIWGWVKYIQAAIDITLCANWADSIVQTTDKAIKESNSTEIANDLAYVYYFYRPTPQFIKEKPLGAHTLLEQVKSQCISNLINHLKEVTKDSLPREPTPWIVKYASEGFRESYLRRIASDKAEQDAAANP